MERKNRTLRISENASDYNEINYFELEIGVLTTIISARFVVLILWYYAEKTVNLE